MSRRRALGVGLLASVTVSCGTGTPPAGPATTIEVRVPEIPFQFENNLILIGVRVNGKPSPAPFILDTGAESSVIDRGDLEALGLRASGSAAADTGGGDVEAVNVKNVVFDVGGSVLPALDVIAIDLAGLESGIGQRLAGILGYEIFRQHAVEIDYVSRVVRLHAPGSYRPARNAQSLPISVEDHIPLITVRFQDAGGKILGEGRVEFDIGQAGSLTVVKAFADAHQLVSPSQPVLQITAGGILSGKVSASVARLGGVQIGSTTFQNIVANVTPTVDDAGVAPGTVGLLGGEVLRRFRVVVDYSQSQVVLEPNQSAAESFEFDMSGMSLAAQGDDLREYRVRLVIPGTPAAAAGIAAGDIITAIDNRPAREMSLTEVRRLFKQPDRDVALDVKRATGPLRVNLRTRRLV